jgi:hypothetical protein
VRRRIAEDCRRAERLEREIRETSERGREERPNSSRSH